MIDNLFPKSVAEARETGARFYFTGEPCSRGHIAKRRTSDRTCIECGRLKHEAQRKTERYKERVRAWEKANPDKVREKYRRYTEKNRQKVRDWGKGYRERNAERIAIRQAFRKSLRRTRDGAASQEQIAAHKQRHGKRCAMCHARAKTTLDHIIPVAKGGTHTLRNIQWLCQPCNSSKGAKPMEDFARSRGLLL